MSNEQVMDIFAIAADLKLIEYSSNAVETK
jgi:hypothetical protein